ncbi:MAG: hypothetical protein ACK53C_05450 [Pseudomonadota bacterium]
MPRSVQYPRASLAQALELAASVEHLGGECALEAAAALTGHSAGGTYAALVAAAVKYGWVTSRKGRLRTTPAFAEYRLSGDEAARRAALATALTCPPLFARLVQRFAGKPLPEGALASLLAREFDVPEGIAPRIAGYFVAGARMAGLLEGAGLRPAGIVCSGDSAAATGGRERTPPALGSEPAVATPIRRDTQAVSADEAPRDLDDVESIAIRTRMGPGVPTSYSLALRGPGIDATLQLADSADLGVARALLERVERALGQRERRSIDE